MRLATYLKDGKQHVAILSGEHLYPMEKLDNRFPNSMLEFLRGEEKLMELAKSFNNKIIKGDLTGMPIRELKNVEVLAPLPNPASVRDAYAFRQHVETARKNRGADMIPEFDQFPIFYFTNHQAIVGGGEIELMSDHFQKLDFELEVAIIIGKKGKNILAEDADDYIAGFTIMNDFSARQLQMEEMKLNLGPAKGKDFATAIGPYMVTTDELEVKVVTAKSGHIGKAYDLHMKCTVNDTVVSEGNLADMDWTFAEIIERASYGVELFPGDVIGSGTVGTGCFLELNGTGKRGDENYQEQWLQDGDIIELEVECLGKLKNTVSRSASDHSIIALKKSTNYEEV